MNKAGIRQQVKALMNRNDFDDALANTFIDQAIGRIQRTLRLPTMEKTEIYTITDAEPETLVLPADYLNIKYLFAENTLLEYVDLGKYLTTLDIPGNTPQMYTRLQAALKVKPTPAEGSTITMIYYGEIPDLVADDDENFLTAIAPDLLTYGALTFAADYFVDDRKQVFEDRYATIYAELEEQSRLNEMDQSALRVQPAYSNY
jgi:hypothetical protein